MASLQASFPSLPSLPTELLQSIAQNLPCSSVLNLILVSRRLNNACKDRLVFRHIAEYGHETKDSERHSWHDAPVLLDGASLSDTIRTAYAIERANKFRVISQSWKSYQPFPPDEDFHITGGFFEWLSRLTALRHPASLDINPLFLLIAIKTFKGITLIEEDKDFASRDAQLATVWESSKNNLFFCLAITTLKDMHGSVLSSIPNSFAKIIKRSTTTPNTQHNCRIVCNFFFPLTLGARGMQCFDQQQVNAYAAIMSLITCIQQGISGVQCPLPEVIRIPFYSFMSLSATLHGNSTLFKDCHIAKMCTPEFLSGDWMGYYSDHRGYDMRLDPPMNSIHLNVRAPSELHSSASNHVVVDPSSAGLDGFGRFHLSGSIIDGRVRLRKTYYSQPWSWAWNGVLVPLGIVGAWSSGQTDSSIDGLFWIWKKGWCGFQA